MLILLSEVAQGYGPAVYLAPEGRWAAVVLPLRRGNLSAQDTNGPGARRSDLPRTTTENELGWSRVRAGPQSRNHANCAGVVEGDDRVVIQPEQDAVERGDLRPIRRQDTRHTR
jgi:hypothetical protein